MQRLPIVQSARMQAAVVQSVFASPIVSKFGLVCCAGQHVTVPGLWWHAAFNAEATVCVLNAFMTCWEVSEVSRANMQSSRLGRCTSNVCDETAAICCFGPPAWHPDVGCLCCVGVVQQCAARQDASPGAAAAAVQQAS